MKIDDAVALVSIITFAVEIVTCLVLDINIKKIKRGFQHKNKTSKEKIIKHSQKGWSAQQMK